jgi:uncharacterized membrane protein
MSQSESAGVWSRERILVIAAALIFLFFGGWLICIPTALEGIGIRLTTAEAVIDVRATYGGLELGLCFFLFIAQGRPHWHRGALLLSALTIGGFGFGRLTGILLAGESTPLMWFFLGIEVLCTGVMTWAYRSAREPLNASDADLSSDERA